MNKTGIFLLGAGCAAALLTAGLLRCNVLQDPPVSNYYRNTTLDSLRRDSIARRDSAFHALQNAYVGMKFGMFLHFNMSTFARNNCTQCYSVSGEHEQGLLAGEVDSLFHPDKLDCGQWARVAKSAGCAYMILVVKHHGGFCLWPTDTAYQTHPHSVRGTPWRSRRGDVVRDFVDSARAYGLEVGFYYSMWDKTNGSSLRMIRKHLTELLTGYGPVRCLWFDGWGWMVGYRIVPYDSVTSYVRSCQPNCLIVENNHRHAIDSTDIAEYEYPAVDNMIAVNNTLPSELTTPIRADNLWFWHPQQECALKLVSGVGSLLEDLNTVNSRHASYLLDLTPDTSGLIPQCQVAEMARIGQLLGVRP